MKDEIKEILEALRDSIDDTGTDKVNFINWVDKIENYITNLQEENEKLLKKSYSDDVIITKLEQKVNKMMSTLKEEVSYLMPYEIYHDEVDSIVEKVEKIVNGGGLDER